MAGPIFLEMDGSEFTRQLGQVFVEMFVFTAKVLAALSVPLFVISLFLLSKDIIKSKIFTGIKWLHKQYKIIITIYDILQNLETRSKGTDQFKIGDNDNHGIISYSRHGHQYTYMVPFQRSYISAMSQFKAQLLMSDDTLIDITQQPGLPYFITANCLGGTVIRITNEETGVSVDYTDKPPFFATEVMNKE